MKKKLIQILMLLVATVSVGSFVSCKDTNEDLYNELRTQNLETATLAQALETRVEALEDLIAQIKSCECDTTLMLSWVNNEDQYLQDQIDAINEALKELAKAENYYTKDEIDRMREFIQNQIDDIPLTYATIEDLNKLIARVAAIEYLKDEVKTLREKLDEIKSCECDCATVMSKLGALEADMAEVKAKVNQALEGLKATDEIAKAAKTLAENAQSAAENAKTLAEQAKSDAAAAKALTEAFQNLYEIAAQNATEAKEAAAAAKTLAESNEKRIATLEETVNKLNTDVSLATDAANDALKAAAEADAKADNNKQLIDNLTERVAKNETNIENLKESVKEMQTLAETVGANTEAIKNLQEEIKKYENLGEEVAALQEQVKNCKETCALNLEAAKAEIRKEIADLKAELVDRISANEAEIKEHHEALKQIAKMIQNFATKDDLKEINDRLDALEDADTKLDERLVNAETTIENLKPRVEKLETDVENLTTRIKDAEDALAALTPKVEKLVGDVAAIQSTLAKQVTGIIVQGTYNPMFGSFSIPANIQSNVLVAYYGMPTDPNLQFPSTDEVYYTPTSSDRITAEDWAIIKDDLKGQITEWWPGMPLLNDVDQDGKAKAGKVYMTINPNTANLDGLQLQIVNTQDAESPIKLDPIRKSYSTLNFGFSRADNGFYEADAYIDSDFEDNDFFKDTDVEGDLIALGKQMRDKMTEAADNFFNNASNSGNLGELATTVYNVIHSLSIPKAGLKCTYTDQNAKGQDVAHSVYSQYNMAAAVLRPLNLKSFKDAFNYKTIPGYEDILDFIDKFAEELNSHVKFIFEDANGSWKLWNLMNNLKIDGVDIDQYANNLILNFKAKVSNFTFDGNGYSFQIPATGNAIIMFDKDLTNGGAAVTIPDAVKFNSYEDLTGVTLVIGGDLPTNATATLYVPAVANGQSTVSAYAFTELSNIAVQVTSGEIEVVYTETGTVAGTVAQLSGNDVTTTGYPEKVVLENLRGTDGSVSIPVAMQIADDAQKIVDKLAEFLQDMNHTLDEINKYKDLIAGDEGWINKGFEKYLIQYLNKINNTTVYFFNSIPRRFGPFMVASTNGKFARLSTSKTYPTTLSKTDLVFYPTTKNMELIVPIARKHVAVTDVFDELGQSAKKDGIYKSHVQTINKQNEELNKVLDGTERRITVDASQMVAGYTYEVSYSVLDFEGNIATEKYYIKIK